MDLVPTALTSLSLQVIKVDKLAQRLARRAAVWLTMSRRSPTRIGFNAFVEPMNEVRKRRLCVDCHGYEGKLSRIRSTYGTWRICGRKVGGITLSKSKPVSSVSTA